MPGDVTESVVDFVQFMHPTRLPGHGMVQSLDKSPPGATLHYSESRGLIIRQGKDTYLIPASNIAILKLK